MRRLIPNKIKIQAVLFLSGVFVFSQAVSLLIYEHNREHTILMTEASDLAARISGIVSLAQEFPSSERRKILASAETQFLSAFPIVTPFDPDSCSNNEFSQEMENQLRSAFNGMKDFQLQVCVRPLDGIASVVKKNPQDALDVVVVIHYPDQSSSMFHATLPVKNSLFSETVVFYLIVLLLVGLLLAWIVIVKLVSPIERLAKAAESIGRDINSSPMNEEGAEEIRVAARSFNQMQSQLKRLINSQTEMFAAISHDLKTSLTRLKLRVEQIENKHQQDGLNRVVSDMSNMIHSILDFIRGDYNREDSRNVEFRALVESLCYDLKDEGFPVNFDSKIDEQVLNCRPVALRRGIQNIIDNAIKYGEAANVVLTSDGSNIILEVTDNGPGIPVESLKDVVKPFYRQEKSRNKKTGGLGLGLAIAQNIIHSHGGQLILNNREGKGLSVRIMLSCN
ncbi:ATP-binding protein [Pleionea litopenaei]|uniref:histidine kinase n=1 Tax=Pleionea litopenaei TaxID=3070815 RepID=A0AA51X755_9GAMM|nr:ATP-binding protein [Pleionea sp. HL-JVS1]WMS87848.1 ATP-binding protein [Pleionea sp. HL-JVS1]